MPQVMTYLIINYPTPELFVASLEATLSFNPAYLEIQLPFSNPVADGPVIWEADTEALKYETNLAESLELIAKIRAKFPNCTTEFILMSYLSRLMFEGLDKVSSLLIKYNYYGLVCPDLPFETPEQQKLSKLWEVEKPCLIPVISPLTKPSRLENIKKQLKPGQMIYPTAKIGTTGGQTDLSNPEVQAYFEFLKHNLTDYKIAVGFGIRSPEQIRILDDHGFIAIVATEIIKNLKASQQDPESIKATITETLTYLHS